MVSLFTIVPIDEALDEILQCLMEDENLAERKLIPVEDISVDYNDRQSAIRPARTPSDR